MSQPLIQRKAQIAGREQRDCLLAETLNASDAGVLFYVGASIETDEPLTERDVAKKTLGPLGSLSSTKAMGLTFRTELNGPDSQVAIASDLNVESIVHQAGNITRVSFSGSPDLSALAVGMYASLRYDANAVNNRDCMITAVNDASDYIEVYNPFKNSSTADVASGSTGEVTVVPQLGFAPFVRGSSSRIDSLIKLSGASITGGPFQRGETVTGGTSNATGRVVRPNEGAESFIYIEQLTGKFQNSETVTGATSSASVALTSGPSQEGFRIYPESCNQSPITFEYLMDGRKYKSRSAMGTFTGQFDANMPSYLDFTLNGPKESINDQALYSGVSRTFSEPPVMKGADLTFKSGGTTFKPVFTTVAFDVANNVVMRQNGNASGNSGIESAYTSNRRSTLTINVEQQLASVFDFYDRLDNETKIELSFKVGNTAGKKIHFFCDNFQFEDLSEGENEGISTLEIQGVCTSNDDDKDDDWEIILT